MQPGGGNTTTLERLRNQYAQDGTSLLFDGAGNFVSGFNALDSIKTPDGQSIRWDRGSADDVTQSFRTQYGNDLISLPQFTIENVDDDNATKLLFYLSRTERDRAACKASAPGLLPEIPFYPGEANIKVTQTNANGANKQRILNCNRPDSLPSTYASDEERRRIVKYEAAAELQESPAPSAIYRDCSTNGCRTATDITVNGRTYYASYGRTQFVIETFLSTLINFVINDATIPAATKTQLGLNQAVLLPNGRNGTISDLVRLARQRAENAAVDYRNNRNRFGRGLSVANATTAWNSLTPAERATFIRTTGLGQNEFVDMLGYQISGRARTEAEGQNAFGTEAALRLLDGRGQPVFRDWLIGLFQSQDNYNYVSRRFLQKNLETVLNSPRLTGVFVNSATPGTDAYRTRQRRIEEDIASRVAVLHNSGNVMRATARTLNLPGFIQDYVDEFIGTAGRGDWRSLRCSDDLADRAGLEFQKLELK